MIRTTTHIVNETNSSKIEKIKQLIEDYKILVQYSYQKFLNILKYKCELCGINLIINEESYTSKCDSLVLEPVKKHEHYLGVRKKRGLFQSSTGKLINADVNGALNILRKVSCDSQIISEIVGSGCLYQPIRFNVL